MPVDYVVDIGNTRIKWGRCSETGIVAMASLPAADHAAWEKQFQAWHVEPRQHWWISGVNAETRERFCAWLHLHGRAENVHGWHHETPLAMDVTRPEKVGIDRKFNAVAVNSRRTAAAAAAVIDAGSAITVDLVTTAGVFAGGTIFPGLRLMAKALHDYTSLLPEVAVTQRQDPPGKSTEQAIAAGIFYAAKGGIEAILGVYGRSHAPLQVFLGGGDAALLAPALSCRAEVWPEMTLEGFRLSALAIG